MKPDTEALRKKYMDYFLNEDELDDECEAKKKSPTTCVNHKP